MTLKIILYPDLLLYVTNIYTKRLFVYFVVYNFNIRVTKYQWT